MKIIIVILSLWACLFQVDARNLKGQIPHETCDFTPITGNCQPPDCFCSSAMQHPNADNLNLEDVPQIVFLSFDGGINTLNFPIYQEIFDGTRQNPNGANISATFFINHEYTSYSLAHQLYRQGHELGLASITHKYDGSYWKNLDEAGWTQEVGEQRAQMAHFAKVPLEQIVGFRAPLLQGGGDAMYNAAVKSSLKYDSSRASVAYTPNLWPYTADFDSTQDCPTEPCHNSSFPGFWVSPLVDLIGNNTSECSMVDACLEEPLNEQDVFDLLIRNFNDHFNGNRSPLGIYANAGWFLNPDKPFVKPGYIRFLDEILQNQAVYIVSINKGLEWMRTPEPLSNIADVPSFQPTPIPEDGCRTALNCVFNGDQLPPEFGGGERIMSSCVLCPPKYPWLGNPLGA